MTENPTPGTATPPDDDDVISEEEQQELLQKLERRRTVRGTAAILVSAVAILFSAFQMWIAARGFAFAIPLPFVGEINLGALQLLTVNAVHVTFALVLAFLLFPPSTGEGFLSNRFAKIERAVIRSSGDGSPLARVVSRTGGFFHWFAVDDTRDRITPLDLLMIIFALLAGLYHLTQFDEIRRMRALGLNSGRTIGDVLPFLEGPAQALGAIGIPFDSMSIAFILGVIGVLLVLDATRRALGIYLMLIVSAFIVYARFGFLIPQNAELIGILSIEQLGWDVIIQNLWYNTENGVFGIPVTVSVQFIYIFILFGAFLEMSGAGQWFIDLAYSATGTRKGGPAKASILASGFMGTISGSSIANTVTTGAFTIPLMKRSGYRSEFAGAVEASASSGGQILPPVMGAAAFLIVEYTLTPFADVIVAAAIPAIVFFFGVWVMVHLEASRVDIGGLDPSEIVNTRKHMGRGWFYLVPLALLLYYLIIARLSVARSAWFTLVAIMALVAFIAAYNEKTRIPLIGVILALFVAEFAAYFVAGVGVTSAITGAGSAGLPATEAFSAAAGVLGWIIMGVSIATLLLRPRNESPLLNYDDEIDETAERTAAGLGRPSLATNQVYRFGTFVLRSMDSGARTATTVVIAVAAAGIIPGVISATGLGPNLTRLILTVAGSSLVLLLLLTAVSSIILGMGMPTTVTYIILVSMLGPAIAEFGIPILAAHLFILYFGVIADITPPVAVAAYAASGIAKSDQFETGVQAFSLSLNKAIVPFAFVLTPGILLIRGVGTGEDVRVINAADVLDVGWFIPEVVLPILAVFVGVVGLGATVIGYLYTDVSRMNRGLFAISALLLMAPGMVTDIANTLAGTGELETVQLALRGVGLALFVLLVVANRRAAGPRAEGTGTVADTDTTA